LEIPVRPTENEQLLLRMIDFVMIPAEVKIEGEWLGKKIVASSPCLSSLLKLRDLLRRERILDSARKFLLRGRYEDTLTFMLHKQALSVGRASFVSREDESPLGPVIFTVRHPRIELVIEWLAPQTREGKPIREIGVPEPDCEEG